MINALIDLVYPPRCVACDAVTHREPFCPPCQVSLVSGTDHACPRCGGVYLTPPPGGGDHLCGGCLRAPPPWARASAALAYGGALRDAIVRWKSRPDHTLSPGLVALFCAAASHAGWDRLPRETVVVPIPSSPATLRSRGFNPAGVLARGLARHLDLDLACALRTSVTGSSRALGVAGRARRVRGAFQAHCRALRGAPVLIVDDVMTTGATARSATRACRRAGASMVEVAVLARRPLDL